MRVEEAAVEKAALSSWPSSRTGAGRSGCRCWVLPPRSPQLDGIVERTNRTMRVECWSQYRGEPPCAAMNEALRRHLDYCNDRRPHRSLGMKTPAEFAGMVALAA